MYKLYKVTNLVNYKSFIGVTQLHLDMKMAKHIKDSKSPLYPLHCEMLKYGSSNFEIELIDEDELLENIITKEQPAIFKYNSHVSGNGYNMIKARVFNHENTALTA